MNFYKPLKLAGILRKYKLVLAIKYVLMIFVKWEIKKQQRRQKCLEAGYGFGFNAERSFEIMDQIGSFYKILPLWSIGYFIFLLCRFCSQPTTIHCNEDTTFKAKDSEKSQGPSCRRQVVSRLRTERFKDSRTRLKIRANINVNIVIMISQAFKCNIVLKMG